MNSESIPVPSILTMKHIGVGLFLVLVSICYVTSDKPLHFALSIPDEETPNRKNNNSLHHNSRRIYLLSNYFAETDSLMVQTSASPRTRRDSGMFDDIIRNITNVFDRLKSSFPNDNK